MPATDLSPRTSTPRPSRINGRMTPDSEALALSPIKEARSFTSTPVSSRVKTPSFIPLSKAEKPVVLPSNAVIEKSTTENSPPPLAQSYATRFHKTPSEAAATTGKRVVQTTPTSSKGRAAAAAADLSPEDKQLISPTAAARFILTTAQTPATSRSNRSTPMSSPPALPLSCKECGETFRYSHLFKAHIESHKAKPTKWCGLCVAQLSPEEDMVKHINEVHIDEQMISTPRKAKDQRCGICFTAVKSLVDMNIHMHTHSSGQKKRGMMK